MCQKTHLNIHLFSIFLLLHTLILIGCFYIELATHYLLHFCLCVKGKLQDLALSFVLVENL